MVTKRGREEIEFVEQQLEWQRARTRRSNRLKRAYRQTWSVCATLALALLLAALVWAWGMGW